MATDFKKTYPQRRKPGRPRKDENKAPGTLTLHQESATRFFLAKEKFEKNLPYELTYAQFLDTLLSNFDG